MIFISLLVNTTVVQNYLAREITRSISKKLKTTVTLKHIRIDFLNTLVLQGLYIEGHAHDTILYAGEAKVNVTDWFILKNEKTTIHSIVLNDAYIHLYRKASSNIWNYDFITEAFSSGKAPSGKNAKPLNFDLKKVSLHNVRFYMDDAWGGSDMDFNTGSLDLSVNTLDFKLNKIAVDHIAADHIAIMLKDYVGGKPHNLNNKALHVIDNTPFNPDKWNINIADLAITNTFFGLTMNDKVPVVNEFDPEHIYIRNINIAAKHIGISGDTLRGELNNLTATERCGVLIKKMKAKVTVSPNASICDDLYLETNNSKLRNYYAMRYERFPDFLSYIDKVTMVISVKDAVVDPKDVAFFAPQLRSFPTYMTHVSGTAKGTVADLSIKNAQSTDGFSTIKGDVHFQGLPDINKTYISYTNGEIMTTAQGIIKYAPAMANDTIVAFKRIQYAYFKGSYTGYINDFAVNGSLKTNLGSLYPDIKMKIPELKGKNIEYSGTIAGENVDLGTLFNQKDVGTTTFKASISGSAFDPQHATVDIDATINNISLKGYSYQNIYTRGTLERKKFNGNLLINDPNIAAAFYGNIDFSADTAYVKATANLLQSNFNALHLTSDTVLAVADFNLDCYGSNIDNFTGVIKLYNLDVKRNQHRLNLDSISISSSQSGQQKHLVIESNDVSASINGRYQLSKLPYSIQYYLSKYIPNYIKVPSKEAPEQNLVFNIATKNIDSLLGVLTPVFRGFDNSVVTGSLNTIEKKLTLHTKIPFGSIGNFRLTNININGDGNLSLIELNTSVDNVSVGDSSLNGSLSVTTTLGNDSLTFNIATVSPDAKSSTTLNGQIIARRDSLFLTILPSQIFINQAEWNISENTHITYADKYLNIQDLVLKSGIQKITTMSSFADNGSGIKITTENVDLAQLGLLAGLGAYQPDGRLNGSIKITNLFSHLQVITDLKGTGVQFGTDTVGNVILAGIYDRDKKLISLDAKSGVYRGNSSLIVSGDISFDSTNQQVLNGKAHFTNAPVVWLSPFVLGFMSQLQGVMNGTVNIGGTSDNPDITGSISVTDAAGRIDFLGSTYNIPTAKVAFSNTKIDLGQVTLYDSYKNTAILNGHFSHQNFKNMRMHLDIKTRKFEAFNLRDNENAYFYGNLVCGVDSLLIYGPFNNINIRVVNGFPAGKSHIYLPISTSTDLGTYSYVSFKTYGKEQDKIKYKSKNKIYINIDGNLNNLAELTMVMDPATGDAINARGTGHIQLQIPSNNDIRMFGTYNITEGDYSFTFRQVAIRRKFTLNDGSYIQFNGQVAQTQMNVDATFPTKTRLYNLLSESEKQSGIISNELSDAQTPQEVDVLLHMKGSLQNPKLTFNIELPERRSIGTYAYTKLQRINQDDQQLFDQVASLLLVYDFIPPEGVGGSVAKTGAVNNISQIVSPLVSQQLTNLISKITGNSDVFVDLKYQSYNLSDPTITGGLNRNQVSLNLRKNYLNDRLVVEVGSTSDWGKPTTTSANSSFNVAGDFRIQYLLHPGGNLRANIFRTSDYDVTLDRNINRSGIGLSWRKSFDGLSEFFKSEQKKDKGIILKMETDTASKVKTDGSN